jgi:hypothetical protein
MLACHRLRARSRSGRAETAPCGGLRTAAAVFREGGHGSVGGQDVGGVADLVLHGFLGGARAARARLGAARPRVFVGPISRPSGRQWSRPVPVDICSAFARMPRHAPAASGICGAPRISRRGRSGSSRHVLASFGSRARRINEYRSGLLIRGFGVHRPVAQSDTDRPSASLSTGRPGRHRGLGGRAARDLPRFRLRARRPGGSQSSRDAKSSNSWSAALGTTMRRPKRTTGSSSALNGLEMSTRILPASGSP